MSTDERDGEPAPTPAPAPPPEDLDPVELAPVLGDRPLRSFTEVTSTQAEARRWAGQDAPVGALVVAGHQAAPRGRSGLSWSSLMERGHGLGFSLLVRAGIPADRQGWLYLAGLLGLVEGLEEDTGRDHVTGEDLTLEWPDQIRRGADVVAALSVRAAAAPAGDVSIVNVVVPAAEPPRTLLLGRLVGSVERRLDAEPEAVLQAYRERCGTLGRRIRARMLPLGPSAPAVVGVAADVREDGALWIQTADGDQVAVSPTALGFLEDPDDEARPHDA